VLLAKKAGWDARCDIEKIPVSSGSNLVKKKIGIAVNR
jgi:hypothetical protein